MPQSTVPKVHVSPFMVVSLALDSVPLGDPLASDQDRNSPGRDDRSGRLGYSAHLVATG